MGPVLGQRHLPYLPHFRLLLKRAESFFLPSPCPVYTSAISYMQKGLKGSKLHLGEKVHRGPVLLGQRDESRAVICRLQALHLLVSKGVDSGIRQMGQCLGTGFLGVWSCSTHILGGQPC